MYMWKQASLGIFPVASAEECAKAIIKGVCRGDLYVTYPFWIKLAFPLKAIFPEIVDWLNRLALRVPTSAFENSHCLSSSHSALLKAE